MIFQEQSTIQSALSEYLEGRATLQEFEDWFMPILWELGEQADAEERQTAGSIANLIAEHSNGTLTEPDLRSNLMRLLPLLPSIQLR
jgi:hypothetical protein